MLATAGAVAAVVLSGAPALADDTVIVRGTQFPAGPEAQLSFVGCETPFTRTTEPLQPTIGRAPGVSPAGQRSLGYDLAGGNAIGALFERPSMASTAEAGLSVFAPAGAQGVAYAGMAGLTDDGMPVVWFGRAALAAGAGAWHQVDAAGLTYEWTGYDPETGQPVTTSRPATVDGFTAERGDAPGLFTVGFGCDGSPVDLDAFRVGTAGDVTTYDIEGLATTVTSSASRTTVRAGEEVVLHAALRDHTGERLEEATLVLEAHEQGADGFVVVEVVPAAAVDPAVVVRPEATTTYRWRFVDRPLAEGSSSPPVTVLVTAPPAEETPSTPPSPSGGE